MSQFDKAIDQLEQEIQVLELAVAKLKQQRDAKPKAVKPPKRIALAGDGKL